MRSLLVMLLACAQLMGCAESGRATSPTNASSSASASASSASASASGAASASGSSLAVLSAPQPLVALNVDGFADAVVALPIGTTSRRRVIIAAHGNYDRPEWQCGVWRSILVYCLSRNVTVPIPCYAHGEEPVHVEAHPS